MDHYVEEPEEYRTQPPVENAANEAAIHERIHREQMALEQDQSATQSVKVTPAAQARKIEVIAISGDEKDVEQSEQRIAPVDTVGYSLANSPEPVAIQSIVTKDNENLIDDQPLDIVDEVNGAEQPSAVVDAEAAQQPAVVIPTIINLPPPPTLELTPVPVREPAEPAVSIQSIAAEVDEPILSTKVGDVVQPQTIDTEGEEEPAVVGAQELKAPEENTQNPIVMSLQSFEMFVHDMHELEASPEKLQQLHETVEELHELTIELQEARLLESNELIEKIEEKLIQKFVAVFELAGITVPKEQVQHMVQLWIQHDVLGGKEFDGLKAELFNDQGMHEILQQFMHGLAYIKELLEAIHIRLGRLVMADMQSSAA